MNAPQGDDLILVASPFDPATRDGEVLEVGGEDGEPPYLVRWADGYLCPEPCAVIRVEDEAPYGHVAKVIQLSDERARRAKRP